MGKKGMWSINFSTAALVLIPAAVGVNYIGKLIASLLKLPLWLDSIGTILASMLAGPIIGAIAGAVNNIIYGLTTDPVAFVYGLTSVAIGLVAGIMAYGDFSWIRAGFIGVVVGLTATIISTPINVVVWGGQTGNIWGDALFAIVLQSTDSIWLASFLNEIVVDLPDKIITVLIAFVLFKSLPQTIKTLYRNSDEIEEI